jgi:glycosyltransferase involved in cell wall biosynthesis
MFSKPHLLIVANNLGRRFSGGDYHILRVVKEWEKCADVTMLASRLFAGSNDYLTPNKVHVKDPIPYLEVSNPYLYMVITMVRAFFLIFSRFDDRYDVVIAPSHYVFHVLPCTFLKSRNRNALLVVYFHDVAIATNNVVRKLLSTAHNLSGLLLVRLSADLVFVINESARGRCLKFGIKEEKIVKTSNAVDVISAVGDNVDIEAREFDACFLGRLEKSKGVFDLLSIWKLMRCQRPNARLAIMGDGPEKERVRKLSMKMGLENNFTLIGFVSGEEKYRMLKSSSVFVFPSYLESWGIAVAEAMSCGLPVVAYDLPVYKEVFEDKLVTVPLGDVDAMVRQVLLLLENPQDAKKTGEANREFVGRYDWSVVAQRELARIMKLTEEGRSFRLLAREQRKDNR